MVTRMRASIAQPATLIATCLVLAAFSPALSNAQVLPDSSAAEAIERAIESIDEDSLDLLSHLPVAGPKGRFQPRVRKIIGQAVDQDQ